MFWKLFLIFTVVPATELYLLIHLGRLMGPLATVLLIVLTGSLGAAMARREGLAVLRRLQNDLASGIPPADPLLQGVLILLGGALLITPGLITDCVGFLLIIPPCRRWLAPRIQAWILRRLASGDLQIRIGQTRTVRVQPKDDPPPPFQHPTA